MSHPKTSTLYYFWTIVTKVSTLNQLTIEKKGFRLFVRLFPCHSSTTTVSEFTRGSSTGAGSGKGHVKSASVSSPGPSAAENSTNSAQQADSLGARYKMTQKQIPHTHTNSHEYTNKQTQAHARIYFRSNNDDLGQYVKASIANLFCIINLC